jgi:hypothetical protein
MGGSMMERSNNAMMLTPLTYGEMLMVRGGSEGWDHDIAEQLGRGAGYTVKKLWRLFLFMSKNLYELQANTQVIYK